jgi:chromosomal replication initiation ATPase DnaA
MIRQLKTIVSKNLDVPVSKLSERTRKRHVVMARQVCYLLYYEQIPVYNRVAKDLGFGVDRTVVKSGIKRIKDLMDTEDDLREKVQLIKTKFYEIHTRPTKKSA